MKKDKISGVANFLYEAGMLAKTPRSGFFFLGSGDQSVAEHTNRTVFAGYCLGQLSGKADIGKVVEMCLFHDISEARTSDLNYVHQKYTESCEDKALEDLAGSLPFGKNLKKLMKEYEEQKTLEAKLARDADNIEMLLSLKEQLDIGNERARRWIPYTVKRIKTAEGKKLAKELLKTDSDQWWFQDKGDKWWVNREK